MSWSLIEFPAAIEKAPPGRENQILSAEIERSGRFPVVDQGQAFIAGYSNAEERVIREGLPLVIFGDHTRCLKYVDFPFILGADGTKVLKPRADLFDAKFFYFALLSLNIPNRGYNRHFSILKELRIPRPGKDEQLKIAGVLGLVQRMIEQHEQLIALTVELKKALLYQLFTEGLRGEPQKQTEIGPVPQSWEVKRLGHYARVQNGYAFKSQDYVKSGVRLIRISNVAAGSLIEKDDKYLPVHFLGKKREYALEEGDLIMSLTRPIISDGIKFCFVRKDDLPALLNQRVGKFQVTSKRLLKEFLSHIVFSDYFTTPLRIMAEGSNQPNVSPTRLENFLIPIPTDLGEQAEIAKILTHLTTKAELADRKRIALGGLFRTLLHQLMTAQIRVHDLNLPDVVARPQKD